MSIPCIRSPAFSQTSGRFPNFTTWLFKAGKPPPPRLIPQNADLCASDGGNPKPLAPPSELKVEQTKEQEDPRRARLNSTQNSSREFDLKSPALHAAPRAWREGVLRQKWPPCLGIVPFAAQGSGLRGGYCVCVFFKWRHLHTYPWQSRAHQRALAAPSRALRPHMESFPSPPSCLTFHSVAASRLCDSLPVAGPLLTSLRSPWEGGEKTQ